MTPGCSTPPGVKSGGVRTLCSPWQGACLQCESAPYCGLNVVPGQGWGNWFVAVEALLLLSNLSASECSWVATAVQTALYRALLGCVCAAAVAVNVALS